MSKKVAQGIRGNSGIWKHGHTYQVRVCRLGGLARWNQSIDIGSSSGLFCCSRCAESYRRREIASECSKARSILGYVFLILVHWTWFLLYVSHRTTT